MKNCLLLFLIFSLCRIALSDISNKLDKNYRCHKVQKRQKVCIRYFFDDNCRPFNASPKNCRIKSRTVNDPHCLIYVCEKLNSELQPSKANDRSQLQPIVTTTTTQQSSILSLTEGPASILPTELVSSSASFASLTDLSIQPTNLVTPKTERSFLDSEENFKERNLIEETTLETSAPTGTIPNETETIPNETETIPNETETIRPEKDLVESLIENPKVLTFEVSSNRTTETTIFEKQLKPGPNSSNSKNSTLRKFVNETLIPSNSFETSTNSSTDSSTLKPSLAIKGTKSSKKKSSDHKSESQLFKQLKPTKKEGFPILIEKIRSNNFAKSLHQIALSNSTSNSSSLIIGKSIEFLSKPNSTTLKPEPDATILIRKPSKDFVLQDQMGKNRKRRDVQCHDKSCKLEFHFKSFCTYYLRKNETIPCDWPCSENGCLTEHKQNQNCPVWFCKPYPNPTPIPPTPTPNPTPIPPNPTPNPQTLKFSLIGILAFFVVGFLIYLFGAKLSCGRWNVLECLRDGFNNVTWRIYVSVTNSWRRTRFWFRNTLESLRNRFNLGNRRQGYRAFLRPDQAAEQFERIREDVSRIESFNRICRNLLSSSSSSQAQSTSTQPEPERIPLRSQPQRTETPHPFDQSSFRSFLKVFRTPRSPRAAFDEGSGPADSTNEPLPSTTFFQDVDLEVGLSQASHDIEPSASEVGATWDGGISQDSVEFRESTRKISLEKMVSRAKSISKKKFEKVKEKFQKDDGNH